MSGYRWIRTDTGILINLDLYRIVESTGNSVVVSNGNNAVKVFRGSKEKCALVMDRIEQLLSVRLNLSGVEYVS